MRQALSVGVQRLGIRMVVHFANAEEVGRIRLVRHDVSQRQARRNQGAAIQHNYD